MTALIDRVRALVGRLAPDPICDKCIAERLDAGSAQRINPVARALAETDGFERRSDICSSCYQEKTVTRQVR